MIIPVHNRASLVLETFASVAAQQSGAEFETIIVDDRSDAAEWALVAEAAQRLPRVQTLHLEGQRRGACAARNTGLAAAAGTHVVFLDSDDLLAPHCLRQRAAAAREQDSDLDFIVFQTGVFHKRVGDSDRVWNIATAEPDLDRFRRGDTVWQTTGPLWRRTSLLQLGGFDEALTCWQDFELHARALARGLRYTKCFDLPPDSFYRCHQKATISQGGMRGRSAFRSQRRVVRRLTRGTTDRCDRRQLGLLTLHLFFGGLNQGFFEPTARLLAWAFARHLLSAQEWIALGLLLRLQRINPAFPGLWRWRDRIARKLEGTNTVRQCAA